MVSRRLYLMTSMRQVLFKGCSFASVAVTGLRVYNLHRDFPLDALQWFDYSCVARHLSLSGKVP